MRLEVDEKKKYRMTIGNRSVAFGDRKYQHFRDATQLQAFKHLDHGDAARRKNYYQRHYAVSNPDIDAIRLAELNKLKNGVIDARQLSSLFLW